MGLGGVAGGIAGSTGNQEVRKAERPEPTQQAQETGNSQEAQAAQDTAAVGSTDTAAVAQASGGEGDAVKVSFSEEGLEKAAAFAAQQDAPEVREA